MGKKGPLWWRESDWLLRGSSAANQILLRHSGPILSGGFCLNACWDTTPSPWEQTPPLPGADTTTPPRSRHPPRSRPPPEADFSIRSTSSRYASYWNAFLYEKNFGQSRNNIIVHTCNILIFTVKIGL